MSHPAQISLLDTIAPQCALQLRTYACLSFLNPCSTLDISGTLGAPLIAIYDNNERLVAVPTYPCYNSCLGMQDLCKPTFEGFNLPLPPWCVVLLHS